MKMAARLVALLMVSAPALAQSTASTSAPASKSPDRGADLVRSAEQDVVYEGELETHIAIGGESTGWRLRRRTPQGRREYIEVLLTADVAQGVRANTRVQVNNGETTVIGGIYKSREQTTQDRTPGLHRVPLLGWLFKRDTLMDENRELLIFITPKIARL